jgi:hypothetical protein
LPVSPLIPKSPARPASPCETAKVMEEDIYNHNAYRLGSTLHTHLNVAALSHRHARVSFTSRCPSGASLSLEINEVDDITN